MSDVILHDSNYLDSVECLIERVIRRRIRLLITTELIITNTRAPTVISAITIGTPRSTGSGVTDGVASTPTSESTLDLE